MKTFSRMIFTLFVSLALVSGPALAHGAKGKEVHLKGEVIGMQCYLAHPDDSRGASHAKCARACINKGLPVGLLTGEGKLYLLLGPGHDSAGPLVADYAGQTVEVAGVLVERDGLPAVQIKSVAKPGE